MKPKLFWTVLLTFLMVIAIGIGGMLSIFGLAIAGVWQPRNWEGNLSEMQSVYADKLALYYRTHDNAWPSDIQNRGLPLDGPAQFLGFVIHDDQGMIIATNDRRLNRQAPLANDIQQRSSPIIVDGKTVGWIAIVRVSPQNASGRPTPSATIEQYEEDYHVPIERMVRGFLMIAVSLMSILMGFAAFFARRLTSPIQNIIGASQAFASGNLEVRAPRAHIRELDDLSQAFNHMAEALSQADQQRRQMTADVAHELRTPLTIIKGRLEGIQDGVYQATPQEVSRLLNETDLLERLIVDLHTLALAEAGQLRMYPETIDPAECAHRVLQGFEQQARDQQVSLRLNLADDLPLIEMDPQRISQVLGNLLTNALRYTPAQGQITLGVSQIEAKWLEFRVADTGCGIAPEALPHIFDRFYRADPSRTRGSGGSGLGLAICKQIIVAHQGEIEAFSTLRKGTTIIVRLPLEHTIDLHHRRAIVHTPPELQRIKEISH